MSILAESAGFTSDESDDEWKISVRLLTRCKVFALSILHAMLDMSSHETTLHLLQLAKAKFELEHLVAMSSPVDGDTKRGKLKETGTVAQLRSSGQAQRTTCRGLLTLCALLYLTWTGSSLRNVTSRRSSVSLRGSLPGTPAATAKRRKSVADNIAVELSPIVTSLRSRSTAVIACVVALRLCVPTTLMVLLS